MVHSRFSSRMPLKVSAAVFAGYVSLAALSGAANAEPKVVATIKPLHALVAGVMEGVGTPGLLMEGAESPHTFALRPSKAQLLSDADVIFWISPQLEPFMAKPLEALSTGALAVEMMEAPNMALKPFREGGPFEAHAHDDHDDHGHEEHAHDDHKEHDEHAHEEHAHDDHKEHDEHAHEEHAHDDHKEHDDHAQEEHAQEEHAHDDHAHDDHGHGDHGHGEGALDPHIWLDPHNAEAMVQHIADTLTKVDPANAATYGSNATKVIGELASLETEIATSLAPLQDKHFMVFHDAYQYFEARFGMSASGSITLSPEQVPGAARISEIAERIQKGDITCVFSEPQFESKLVNVVIGGTNARTVALDPLGAGLDASASKGAELYISLMRDMAGSFKECLSPAS